MPRAGSLRCTAQWKVDRSAVLVWRTPKPAFHHGEQCRGYGIGPGTLCSQRRARWSCAASCAPCLRRADRQAGQCSAPVSDCARGVHADHRACAARLRFMHRRETWPPPALLTLQVEGQTGALHGHAEVGEPRGGARALAHALAQCCETQLAAALSTKRSVQPAAAAVAAACIAQDLRRGDEKRTHADIEQLLQPCSALPGPLQHRVAQASAAAWLRQTPQHAHTAALPKRWEALVCLHPPAHQQHLRAVTSRLLEVAAAGHALLGERGVPRVLALASSALTHAHGTGAALASGLAAGAVHCMVAHMAAACEAAGKVAPDAPTALQLLRRRVLCAPVTQWRRLLHDAAPPLAVQLGEAEGRWLCASGAGQQACSLLAALGPPPAGLASVCSRSAAVHGATPGARH